MPRATAQPSPPVRSATLIINQVVTLREQVQVKKYQWIHLWQGFHSPSYPGEATALAVQPLGLLLLTLLMCKSGP